MAPASVFLTAQWRDLAVLNFAIEPAVVAGLVPAGTELDDWNGTTLVSVVGFRFLDTRVRGLAIPGHRDFDEVNLRFYVRRRAPDGWRRGVVFVREIVPRRAVAWVARRLYNEPYVARPMRHQIAAGRLRDEWRQRGHWQGLALAVAGSPVLPSEGSEEQFVTEHHWGYTRQRDGSTLEYQVEHPRWPVWRAAAASFDGDVSALYGAAFTRFLRAAPRSAFMAEGSEVTVRRGIRW